MPILGVSRESSEPVDFIVWGDSHCRVLGTMIESLGKEHGLSCAMAAKIATPPLIGIWQPDKQDEAIGAPAWNDFVMQYIRDNRVSNVFLISRWTLYLEGNFHGNMRRLIADEQSVHTDRENAKAVFRASLTRTLDELEKLGARVWIMKQVPNQYYSPKYRVARAVLRGQEIPKGVSAAIHRDRQKTANSIIDAVAKGREGVLVCDPVEYCFDELGYSRIANEEGIFYRDGDHLCHLGANRLLRPMFESALVNEMRVSSRKMGRPSMR